LTPQCQAIKANGVRCRGAATGQHGLCWAHDPANSAQRRRTASRGGRGGPTREVAELKAEVKSIMAAVQDGTLDRNIAVVVFQGYRVLHNFIELERRVKETDELEVRLLDLEDAYVKGEG
jgi:hypothetical protein